MAFSIGEAIAMGVTQGIGQGAGQVFQQKREERLQKEAELREETRYQSRFKQQSETEQKTWEKREAASAKTRAAETAESRKYQTGREDVAFTRQQTMEGQRQRFEVGRIAAATQESKKLSIFNQNLSYIGNNLDKMKSFQTYGKMDVGQIAQQLSLEAAKAAPAKLQQQVFQDTMSRFHGMSKQEMLGQAGLVPQDLSEFANNPEYKDAIPKGYIAGMQTPAAGMDQVFKYEAPSQNVDKTSQPTGIQLMYQRQDGYRTGLVNNAKLAPLGISDVSESVLVALDTRLQQGKVAPYEFNQQLGVGQDRIYDFAAQGIKDGSLVVDPLTKQLVTKDDFQSALMRNESVATGGAPMAPQGTTESAALTPPASIALPKEQQVTPMVSTQETTQSPVELPPTGEEMLVSKEAEKKAEEAEKEYGKEATTLSENIARTGAVKMAEPAARSVADLDTASPEVIKVLEGFLADGKGDFADAINMARRATSKDAVEAKKILQNMQTMRNVYTKEMVGATQTDRELQNIMLALGQGGWKGSIGELKNGLRLITEGSKDLIAAQFEGQDPNVVDVYKGRAGIVSKLMEEHPQYGSEEGKIRSTIRERVKAGELQLDRANAYLKSVGVDELSL